jgi:hypothetical protein
MVRRLVAKTSKYGANKVEYNGMQFDSKYELERYLYLVERHRRGEIECLRRQTPFLLIPKTLKTVEVPLKTKIKLVKRVVELEALYHNDFSYIENGKYFCEEFKSCVTSKLPDYILRRKLMVQKIYAHNAKNHGQWVFREVVYYNKRKTVITDK